MSLSWANDLSDIHRILAIRPELKAAMLNLIRQRPIAAKAAYGGVSVVRSLLESVVEGRQSIECAGQAAQRQVPVSGPYAHDKQVFNKSWGKGLIKTEFNRFYNQAALEAMIAEGITACTIPHSRSETSSSGCKSLHGRTFEPRVLLANLVAVYEHGRDVTGPMVPYHPHCSHVARPL